MRNIINNLYKNYSIIYKVVLLIATILFIAYLFPSNTRFKYEYEVGKPWQAQNLYAPFSFPIKKTFSEIDEDKKEVIKNEVKYFDVDESTAKSVKASYNKTFNRFLSMISNKSTFNKLKRRGRSVLNTLYKNGLLSVNHDFDKASKVIILNNQVEERVLLYEQLSSPETIKTEIQKLLDDNELKAYESQLIALFYDLAKPNLAYNASLTEKVLKEQLDALSNTKGSIEKGTLLISKGEVVDDETFRVISSLKSEYQTQNNDSNRLLLYIANVILIALTLIMLLLFLRKYRNDIYSNTTKVAFIFFNITVSVVLVSIVVAYNVDYLYVVPVCIAPLVLKAFFDARLGLFAHVITVLLIGAVVPYSYEYIFLQLVAGIVTVLTVSELHKRVNLFISVGEITLVYVIGYVAFHILQELSITTLSIKTLGMFVLCGLATLFVQPLIYMYERLFGLVSDLSLLELSDTNMGLLKELSNEAPGTFHHSLNVANLCETAADEIGANTTLVRVGALYHDIGKMKTPNFFTENQASGVNPHDDLDPKESAKIIIDHVVNGIELAKKYKLPDRIIDFIRTHHGTSSVYYFYKKALQDDETIAIEDFLYPGPKPFSKETAILMMCDSIEAASRSLKEPTSIKIDELVESVFSRQLEEEQFLNADITFREIQSIKKVLKRKLANMYHIRIEYPE